MEKRKIKSIESGRKNMVKMKKSIFFAISLMTILLLNFSIVLATTDEVGGGTGSDTNTAGYWDIQNITASSSGDLTSLGIKVNASSANHIRLGIYSTYGAGTISGLLASTAYSSVVVGWNDVAITNGSAYLTVGNTYWIAETVDGSVKFNWLANDRRWYGGPGFPSYFSDPQGSIQTGQAGQGTYNMRMTYTSITPPVYSLNQTNSTVAGTQIKHSLYWLDNSLSGYIFSFDNGTGSMTNDTWAAMTGIGNWSNVTKFVNSTIGTTIRWCVYANNSVNAWNGTSCATPFSYITTIANSPPQYYANITTIINPYTGISAQSLFNVTELNVTGLAGNATLQIGRTNYTMTIISTNSTMRVFGYAKNLGNQTQPYNFTIYINTSQAGQWNKTFPDIPFVIQKGALIDTITGANVTYPTAVNICPSESNTGAADVNFTYWRNVSVGGGTLVSSAINGNPACDTSLLGAGTYSWIINTSAGPFGNWTVNASIALKTFTVLQGTPTLGVQHTGGWVYPSPAAVSFNEIQAGDSDVNYTAWRNSTPTAFVLVSSANGTAPATDNSVLGVGTYSWKLNSTAGTNWTAGDSGYLTLTESQGAPSLSFSSNVTSPIIYPTASDVRCTVSNPDSNEGYTLVYSIWVGNDTRIGGGGATQFTGGLSSYDINATWGAGIYSHNCSVVGNTNWTSSSATNYTLTVSKAAVMLNLSFNNLQANLNITYGTAVNASGWRNLTAGYESMSLYRNGTIMNSSISRIQIQEINSTIPIGVWNYTIALPNQNNMTATAVQRILTIINTTIDPQLPSYSTQAYEVGNAWGDQVNTVPLNLYQLLSGGMYIAGGSGYVNYPRLIWLKFNATVPYFDVAKVYMKEQPFAGTFLTNAANHSCNSTFPCMTEIYYSQNQTWRDIALTYNTQPTYDPYFVDRENFTVNVSSTGVSQWDSWTVTPDVKTVLANITFAIRIPILNITLKDMNFTGNVSNATVHSSDQPYLFTQQTKYILNASSCSLSTTCYQNGTFIPKGQTTTQWIYNLTNPQTYALNVSVAWNASIPTCMTHYLSTNSSLELTTDWNVSNTTFVRILSNFAAGTNQAYWGFFLLNNCTAGTSTNSILNFTGSFGS